ncbi:2-iminobutanoate/2-iminopropanoate deaminase rida [Holotrichia oblita]|nr:2-iminobutanoate/2-iminopropanoate deaminase rida [Holotrichia oblita]
MKKIISTLDAPGAIGPYSQAVKAGDLIFVSGQLPINPRTGNFAADDIKGQVEQVLKNVSAILESCDLTLESVVKTTVFLKDINDFADMNEVYGKFFKQECPARSAFQVAALPKNALVEIETVAYSKDDIKQTGTRI